MDSLSLDMHALDGVALREARRDGVCDDDGRDDDARREETPSHPVAMAGDVILSRGVSCMSEWMAWNARCAYSHAAIVLAPTIVLEAVAPTARLRPLSTLASEPHAALDLYRPRAADGGALSEQQIEAAVRIGLRLIGTPFAMARLPGLALRTLSSRRFDGIRCTPDACIAVHDLNCCELVYLVLRDAFGFDIGMRTPRDQPRPEIDWGRFLEDWRRAHGQADKRRFSGPALPFAAHRVPKHLTTSDLAGNPRLHYIGSLLRPSSSAFSTYRVGMSAR